MGLQTKVLLLGVMAMLAPQLIEAASAVVGAAPNQKITMVVETLKDIQQSVVSEEAQETTVFNKYMAWCTKETASMASDLSEARTELENAKVLAEEKSSNIENLKLFIEKSEKDLEETKDAVAQATALRTDEKQKYTEEMQMNTQSLRQIDLAIKHVGKVQKQGGFLQNGEMHKLQINQPGESSYVFGIMKGLKDKLEASRKSMQDIESEKVTMHDDMMKTKGESLKAMTDALFEKKITLAETSALLAGVKRKIGGLSEQVAKLVADETAKTCANTKTEWTEKQADRVREKAALGEAIRFLTETSFEQLSLVQRDSDDTMFATSFLQTETSSQKEDREFDAAVAAAYSSEDAEFASHMQKDSFKGVQSVVAKLISTHQDTQGEEKTKKNYCEKEIASKEEEKEDTSDELDAVKANVEKKAAEVVTLADEISKLEASIVQARKSVKEAGELRKQETTIYKTGTKDSALAIKVLNQAMTVLQKFYNKKAASLMQRRPGSAEGRGGDGEADGAEVAPPPRPSSGNSRKEASSFGAVSMLQDIVDDMTKEQKDSDAQEADRIKVYKKLQVDTEDANDDKQQFITERVTAKAKLGVQINSLKETQTEKSQEVASITQQLAALHTECDELMQNFDKRKKARGFEVSQLRDVMDILAGSSGPGRTFLQKSSSSSEDADAALA